MRALSKRQITRCETSHKPRCKCRCKGQLHGVRQGDYCQMPMFHIPPEQRHQPEAEGAVREWWEMSA